MSQTCRQFITTIRPWFDCRQVLRSLWLAAQYQFGRSRFVGFGDFDLPCINQWRNLELVFRFSTLLPFENPHWGVKVGNDDLLSTCRYFYGYAPLFDIHFGKPGNIGLLR